MFFCSKASKLTTQHKTFGYREAKLEGNINSEIMGHDDDCETKFLESRSNNEPNLAEPIPTLQTVGFGHCLVCSRIVPDLFDLSAQDVDAYLKCICEVVGLEASGVDVILDKFDSYCDFIAFCESCRQNLSTFQQTQHQLSTLKLQLEQTKDILRCTLRHAIKQETETPISKLRTCLLTESKFCKKSNEEETIPDTGDIDYNSDDAGASNLPFWWDGIDFSPSVASKRDLKPCRIILTRLEATEGVGSATRVPQNTKGRRKPRLSELLKRHDSKVQRNELHRKRRNYTRMEQRITQRKFKCSADPNCQHSCNTEEMLRFHVRRRHERCRAIYNCSSCEAEFMTIKELRTHVNDRNHHAPGSEKVEIECERCRRVFRSQLRFDAHLERQGGECKRGQSLPLNSVFDRSQRKSHRFICGECGRKYRSLHYLSIHIRASHTEGFAFLCEFCCKPFKVKRSLTGHQRKVHPKETLASQQNPEVTLQRIRNLTCETCQMTFTSLNGKRNHIVKQHLKVFKFFCQICGSGWVSATELRKHSVSHTTERNFPCTHCEMKFNRGYQLSRHIRNKHGDGTEKSFKCEHCPKRFYDKTAIQRHMTIMHRSPDEPDAMEFSCDICSYTCAIKDYLTIHRRTKKHLQKVAELGQSDPNTRLQ